ncbi:hypothetical protein [Paenibacillus rigui]|uniref:Uncharacterized protein n=1 Tax=Paenibacillus rigui TaxID=554312 RepID=A0A229UKH8_9BACL|nr:hypothetical protein [Paenibacillus rigui]OXM83958.1 hypothetical protein CF651_22865 [Paenibacillus rigui]
MLILEIIDWILDNPGDATIWTILALIARKIFLSEIERVIQMGRDEELIWTREQVEQLTGQKWNGPQPILKRARIQYIGKYYFYLLGASRWGYQLRRERKMNQQINWVTLIPCLIGAVKLILQPFGVDLTAITDQNVNEIANGAAALATVIGVLLSHKKKGAATNGSIAPYTGDGPAI